MSKAQDIASVVGANLIGAEKASDRSFLELANLSASLMEARLTGEFKYLEGQGVLSDVTKAQALAVELRFHVGRAHSRLAGIARDRGIDWTMFGDEYETEDVKFALAEKVQA